MFPPNDAMSVFSVFYALGCEFYFAVNYFVSFCFDVHQNELVVAFVVL